ncbi:uncharacterized protein LOC130679965 [Manis pentadactyla]|uniref:uncharacterized protein LOC130679965 n=1 Tax=Manis pentadactyla TaxID=143292 RepID=UPI00255C50B1|nr:uncharacterized protein LOC130679965 [Manis pentadactyla]
MRPERPHPFSRWRTSRALQGAGLPRNSTRTWPGIGATERRGGDWGAEAKLPTQLSVMADRETGPQAGRHCQPPDVLPALKEQYASPWAGPEGEASPAQMLPLSPSAPPSLGPGPGLKWVFSYGSSSWGGGETLRSSGGQMLRGAGSLGLSPPQSSPSCPPVPRWAHLLHRYVPGVGPWARHREYIPGRGPCPVPRGWGGDESPPTSGAPTELLLNPTPAAPSSLGPPCAASLPFSLHPALLSRSLPGLAFGQSQDLWSLHLSSNFSPYPAAIALLVTPVLAAQGSWHQATPLSPDSPGSRVSSGPPAIASTGTSPPARSGTLRCSCSPPTRPPTTRPWLMDALRESPGTYAVPTSSRLSA